MQQQIGLPVVFKTDRDRYGIGVSAQKLPHAALMLADAMTFADEQLVTLDDTTIAQELARLALVTSNPNKDEDLEAKFVVYIEELREYPADLLLWALRSWIRRDVPTGGTNWFPTISELHSRIAPWHEKRKFLRSSIQASIVQLAEANAKKENRAT